MGCMAVMPWTSIEDGVFRNLYTRKAWSVLTSALLLGLSASSEEPDKQSVVCAFIN